MLPIRFAKEPLNSKPFWHPKEAPDLRGKGSHFTQIFTKRSAAYFSFSCIYVSGLLGSSLADDTLITIGFSSRFWISDNSSLSSETDSSNSSMFPAGLPNLVVFDFTPEKNVYIFTQSVAVPWILLCASAIAMSFLDGPPFVREDFFSEKKNN